MQRMAWICRWPGFGILAVALLCLSGSVAHATQVMHVALPELTRGSDVVVLGEVVAQAQQLDPAGQRVVTLTTVRVLQAVKGARAGDSLEIFQVGGEVDGLVTKIVGALRFRVGEKMVFFGVRRGGYLVSYGMGQGKYRVEETAGVWWVQPEYGAVTFVEPAPTGAWQAATVRPTALQRWTKFKELLRSYIPKRVLPLQPRGVLRLQRAPVHRLPEARAGGAVGGRS